MSRALKYDVPGRDLRLAVESIREEGLERAFEPDLSAPLRLVVEIGFGRGEFLMDLAAKDPEAAHLGVEYSFKRTLKMARRLARRADLGNVRLVQARGEVVVDELCQSASVSAFWVNFPDPWPKKRHHKRRLIQPAFVRLLADRLVPGGVLHVATDHADYAEWIDEILSAEPMLENANAPHRWLRDVSGRTATAYELEWRAEGRSLHFWTYRRRD